MASSQMIVSLTVADFENIVQRAVLSALSGKSVPAPSSSTKKAKKEKKEKDPNAPKKEPNDWIKFTSKVREALKAANIKAGVEVTQFCGMLKTKNADYASWTPEAILTEHSGWTRPEVSKQALAKSPEPSPADPPVAADAKKTRKPQSDETKKAAAEKRAATKAAKSAASAPLPASPAPKAKAPVPAPAAEAEEEDNITDFAPWTFKKAPYLKNKRGDVLSEEYDWIGRFDEKAGKIDRAFPKPADLEEE
jgi:hypothetical protein